jgi:hypothetical protein
MEISAIAQTRKSAVREDWSSVSEEIGKSAIKGYLICFPDYSTYATLIRVKTSVYLLSVDTVSGEAYDS